ncbi:MAG TPA: hypothetical protein P5307_22375 [Pirellulaceae bacterium]|nr:hypothetical protein [Pirellulaceae bacterium]
MQISLTQLEETLRDVVDFGDRETGNIIVVFGNANKAVGCDKPEGNMLNRVVEADGPVDVRVSVNVGILDSANR